MKPARRAKPSAPPRTTGRPPGISRGRPWLWIALALVAALGSFGIWRWMSRPPGRPHAIVLISIDTLRADRLPLYGYSRGRTPVLDAFAKEAVLFERAYAHAPQTLPSHASMFTGELPFDHGVRDNLGFVLGAGQPTLAELMSKSGFKTGGFVSSYVLRGATGIGRGFATYDDKFPEGGIDRSPGQIQRGGEATLAAATAWLDTLPDDHFFLLFHLFEPHMPYRPPQKFAALEPYDGEVAYADEIVGRLFDDLKRRGWYDNATIVVLADHGEGLGDHGELEHGLFVYDEAIHVPWIVKTPGAKSGRRLAAPVQHIDLLPTLLSIAGRAPLPSLRGRDLSPLLFDRGAVTPQGIYSEALYARYHFGWSELIALTDDRYRFIKAPREELYDLERDPDERTNLIAERAQAAQAMRAGLDRLVAGKDLGKPTAVTDEDRERLAALGYVGTQFSAPSSKPGASLPDPKDMAPVLKQYRAAIDLLDARDLNGGAAALGALLKANPDMTDVWMQYASVLTRLGRDEQALAAFREVVRLKPDEPSGLLGAASALLSLGRLDDARAHALIAVKSAPANAHEMLARVALARKNYPEALKQAELAAQADPQLPLPVFVRGLAEYQQGRYEAALPLLIQAREQWAKRTIQTPDLRFYIGDTLARLERYPEAERYFVEELRLFPNSLRTRAGLAMLYQSSDRPDEAAKTIDEMLRVIPSPRAYQTAAQLWQMFGRPDRADAVKKESAQRFPGDRVR